jgi:hypothetical protein
LSVFKNKQNEIKKRHCIETVGVSVVKGREGKGREGKGR